MRKEDPSQFADVVTGNPVSFAFNTQATKCFENMKTKLRDHFFIISHSIYGNIRLNAVNFGGRVASGFCSQPRNLVQLSGLRLWGNVDYLGNMRWRGEQQVQVDRYLHRYLQYLPYKGCRYVLTDLECWRMISEKYHI